MAAGVAQIGRHLVSDEGGAAQHHAAQGSALAVDMLRRGIEGDVGPQLQGTLQHGGREHIVDDQARAGGFSEPRDLGDVDDLQRRIGGRLDEDAARRLGERTAPLLQLRAVHQHGLDAEPRQQLLDDVAAGAEQRARGDHAVAGLELTHQRGIHRRHPARHRARGGCAFQQRHPLLEHGDGWIAVAAVDEARLLILEAGLRRLGARIAIAGGQE
jgi:hypothetical protein